MSRFNDIGGHHVCISVKNVNTGGPLSDNSDRAAAPQYRSSKVMIDKIDIHLDIVSQEELLVLYLVHALSPA